VFPACVIVPARCHCCLLFRSALPLFCRCVDCVHHSRCCRYVLPFVVVRYVDYGVIVCYVVTLLFVALSCCSLRCCYVDYLTYLRLRCWLLVVVLAGYVVLPLCRLFVTLLYARCCYGAIWYDFALLLGVPVLRVTAVVLIYDFVVRCC